MVDDGQVVGGLTSRDGHVGGGLTSRDVQVGDRLTSRDGQVDDVETTRVETDYKGICAAFKPTIISMKRLVCQLPPSPQTY